MNVDSQFLDHIQCFVHKQPDDAADAAVLGGETETDKDGLTETGK